MISLENGNLTETRGPEVFSFGGAEVRTAIDAGGEPWFIALDVCRVLEIGNPSDAISGLDDDERATLANPEGNPRAGIPHTLNVISESGLYSLILRSRKPEAKAFKRWVTHEVLPALRKTGRFAVQAPAALPASYPEALRALALEVEAKELLQAQAAVMQPKAEFYDAVTASTDTLGLNEAAKLVGLGRNRLMAAMRSRGILRANNTPYQSYIDAGYFRVVESKWEDPEGASHVTLSTRVFQRGVEFLKRTLASEGGAN